MSSMAFQSWDDRARKDLEGMDFEPLESQLANVSWTLEFSSLTATLVGFITVL